MPRIVYVNGKLVREEEAKISVFDRGFLFADSVYEVTTILNGALIDSAAHFARLKKSLAEISIPLPLPITEIEAAQKDLIARNNLKEGLIYLQVTRGEAERDFAFPKDAKPGLVMFTQEKNILNNPAIEKGLSIAIVEDLRWRRRDIKTTGLLPASMAKQAALNAGADDAWMMEEGFITEASSANAFIVNNKGVIITRPLGHDILAGTTRAAVLRLREKHGITLEERPFTPEEAYAAAEAFITSASTFVMPVVRIDNHQIGDGKPGPLTKKLRHIYIEAATKKEL